MATPSSMLPLGTLAPDFCLTDAVSGKPLSLTKLHKLHSSQGTVIMFICNHCPYVKHILLKLLDITRIYTAKSIQFIAVNANDVKTYPEDSPANMKTLAEKHYFCFPYLWDEHQTAAKSYQAACTPDFFVFDRNLACVYRGRFDESTPRNTSPVTGEALSNALDCLLAGLPIPADQRPSIGCSIKWQEE